MEDEPRKCLNCKHWKPRRPGVRSCRNTMSEYYGDEPEEYDGCDAWEGEEGDDCDKSNCDEDNAGIL